MTVTFDQTGYTPDDTMSVSVDVDNSLVSVPLQKVSIQLMWVLQLSEVDDNCTSEALDTDEGDNSGGGWKSWETQSLLTGFYDKETVHEVDYPGVPARTNTRKEPMLM